MGDAEKKKSRELNRFLQSLREEDLHPDLRVLMPVVGMDVIRTLLEHFPGQTFYFGFASRMTGAVRRYVAQHYVVDSNDRNNARQLARDCG